MDWARTTTRRNEKHLSLGFGVPYITGLMVFVFWLTLLMNLGGGHILQLTSNILLWVVSGPPGILVGNIGLVEIAEVSSLGALLHPLAFSGIILHGTHNRQPIAHLWGWAMGCLLWVQIIAPYGFVSQYTLDIGSLMGIIIPPLNEVERGVYWNEIVRQFVCRHNPVNALPGAILLWLQSNLVGTYLGARSRTSSFMGDAAH